MKMLLQNYRKNFKAVAFTKSSKLTIIENSKEKIYGIQFHPEVSHTDNGKQIFKNFLFLICKIKRKWNVVLQKKKNYSRSKRKSSKP